MPFGTFFIFSRGADTIFLPGEAENTTFAFLSWERKWHFRPGYGEKYLIHLKNLAPKRLMK